MLNSILNIFGIVLIIYSIYTIKKDVKIDKSIINNLDSIEEKVKEYYNLTEEIIEDFDKIVDSKLEILNNLGNKNEVIESSRQNVNLNNKLINNIDTSANTIDINILHKKIIELHFLGLTNQEIAKKLSKGIREIEIILKIYDIKNTDKNIQK